MDLESPLSICQIRARGQIEQEFKNDSKKEVWLWRFMENLEIECVAL